MPASPSNLSILDYSREELPEPAVGALVAMLDAKQAELRPEDPPLPRATRIADIREPDIAGLRSRWIVAWRGEEAVGFVESEVEQHDNPDIVWLTIYVRPAHRRHGIGRALTAHALDELRSTLDPAPTQAGFDVTIVSDIGRELRTRIEQDWGLSVAFVGRKARLDVATVDRASIEAARDRRLAGLGDLYKLLFFENMDIPGPETGFQVEDFCTSYEEILNLMPLEDLQIERQRFPPERWRSLLERLNKTERTMWNLVCCEPEGHVVGLTIIGFTDADHRRVDQWDTGVLAEAQGKGIGSTLKLDMLLRILDGLPNALFIDTDNAGSNEPMIAINTALGFYEHWMDHIYQLPIAQLYAHLGVDAP